MDTLKRIPQVASEPMPELDEFLNQLAVRFGRSDRRRAIERYLAGLLSEHPNKNCDTLAQIVADTNEQQLQGLLTAMNWDATDLNWQRVRLMQTLPSEGDGVLVFDGTDFPKQGKHSVGVARQYSGSLGKLANCQVTINCHYAERTIAWPVTTRLYLPQDEWADDAAKCAKAQVPHEIEFQTKYAIALDLLDDANEHGVPHAAIIGDADFGDQPAFLDGLEARAERYVMDVRCNFSVSSAWQAHTPVVRADALIQQQPQGHWRTVRWREGSHGWLSAKCLAVRGWRVDGQGQRSIGWLLAERPRADGSGRWKYYWSNFPPSLPLETMIEYAHRRHSVEQFHQVSKSELGWDQYQGRLWTGFHRHASLTMLAFSFLVWLEWRQRTEQRRRGRPRGAFSPSARPSASVAGRHSSLYRRMAPSSRPAGTPCPRPTARSVQFIYMTE